MGLIFKSSVQSILPTVRIVQPNIGLPTVPINYAVGDVYLNGDIELKSDFVDFDKLLIGCLNISAAKSVFLNSERVSNKFPNDSLQITILDSAFSGLVNSTIVVSIATVLRFRGHIPSHQNT